MAPDTDACAALLQHGFGTDVLCDVVPLDERWDALPFDEQSLVARAVPARRREFAAGRACARRLLERLGFASAPLLRADDRAPLWPRGAIGSVAHHSTLCAVAAARAGRLASLGLDTEPDAPLEDDLWSSICTPRELRSLSARPPASRGRIVRLLFSAKESVFKCVHPPDPAALGFHDVEIELDSAANRFRAVVRSAAPAATATVFEGFHFASAGSIFTGTALPCP